MTSSGREQPCAAPGGTFFRLSPFFVHSDFSGSGLGLWFEVLSLVGRLACRYVYSGFAQDLLCGAEGSASGRKQANRPGREEVGTMLLWLFTRSQVGQECL
jgi:hypothetical protein